LEQDVVFVGELSQSGVAEGSGEVEVIPLALGDGQEDGLEKVAI